MSHERTRSDAEISIDSIFPFHNMDHGELCSVRGHNKEDDERLESYRINSSCNFVANWIMKEERRKFAGKNKIIDLSICFNLPIDLILEIFGHLHPLDLYNIARTSKALRSLALMRNAASVWKTAFQRHPSLPQCPPDLSEPHWTTLLFGPVICDGECGRHGALINLRIDDTFVQVVCSRKLFLLVNSTPRTCTNPKISYVNSCHLPSETTDVAFRHRDYDDQLYYIRDLAAMATSIKAAQKALTQGELGAGQTFESFKMATRAQALSRMEQDKAFSIWGHKIYLGILEEMQTNEETHEKKIVSRLIKLGHDEHDVKLYNVSSILIDFSIVKLTRSAWRKSIPPLEAIVAKNREQRKVAERQTLLQGRGFFIKKAYIEYQKTISPMLWKYLPDFRDILDYDLFSAIMNDPSDLPVNPDMMDAAVQKLPEYLANWRNRKRKELLVMLPDTADINLNDLALSDFKLGLATSVFTCVGCKSKKGDGMCLLGGEAVNTHVQCSASGVAVEFLFSNTGSCAAMDLVEFLELDPSTSLDDMDRIDARFLCGNCPIQASRGLRGRKVITWRECISHAIQMESDAAHFTNYWHLLTPEATDIFRVHEDKYPHPKDKAWSCMHCPAHFCNYMKRRAVLEHVQTYDINSPAEGIDFLYDPSPEAHHSPRRPVVFGEMPVTNLRCKICPELVRRLLSMTQLSQHLWDKHEITTPVPDEHFFNVEIILKSSIPPST